jgi:crotonobetainyl-CoA:carnitine CoA-transferase CaiB-like acyl-CoA transferase
VVPLRRRAIRIIIIRFRTWGSRVTRPLEGLLVLDLTSTLAGSYCTKLWVDAGAEVVKVESPAGDPLRRRRVVGSPASVGEHSPLSSFLHAGKGSVIADVAQPAGRDCVLDLARTADLVVESTRPGTMEGWVLRRTTGTPPIRP